MCFGGGPDIPPMPEPKDPILPQQPIQPQQPANLGVGRKDEEEGDKKRKIAKSRRKLRKPRISNSDVQTTSSAQKSSGVSVGSA